jgi:pimeloyl-ACP methyl ester carboxylesterase
VSDAQGRTRRSTPPVRARNTLLPPAECSVVGSGQAQLAVTSRGAGPAVVFLHSGVADQRCWESSFPGWRTITWDRRGFGQTTWVPEPHAHVEDLIAVLDAIGERQVVLVGNSQGGRIAIDATLARPERVRGLVLVASAVSGAPEPEIPSEVREIVDAFEAAERAGDFHVLNRLEARCWLDGPMCPEGRVGGSARQLLLQMNLRILTAGPVGEERQPPPAWPELHRIAVPVRVIVGLLDLPHVIHNARHIARTVQNGELVEWDNVAHLPSLEAPERLDREIASFLASL